MTDDAVLMSIRPRYAHQILAGEKDWEYRKQVPDRWDWSGRVIIYATKPTGAVVGEFQADAVHKDVPLGDLLDETIDDVPQDRQDVREYFDRRGRGCALHVDEVEGYDEPIELEALHAAGIHIPHNFCYVDPDDVLAARAPLAADGGDDRPDSEAWTQTTGPIVTGTRAKRVEDLRKRMAALHDKSVSRGDVVDRGLDLLEGQIEDAESERLVTDGGEPQGAIDNDYGDAERDPREILAANLSDAPGHEHAALGPGDLAIDLVTRQLLYVVARPASDLVEYYEEEGFDLGSYKYHPYLPVRHDDAVLTCLYLSDMSAEKLTSWEGAKTYDFPAGRLARVPIEAAWEGER